jgi:hypothetical protein
MIHRRFIQYSFPGEIPFQAEEFSQVAKAVLGMDSLLKAAPPTGPRPAAPERCGARRVCRWACDPGFSLLEAGLKPDMVAKAVPVLTSFVGKSGGANVGSLLAGALR